MAFGQTKKAGSAAAAVGPDSRESCRMAFVCVCISFLCSAGFRSAGFLYVGIMETFDASRQEASWPLSLIGGITNLAGLIAGPLCQHYPTRPVMCGGALLAASGMIFSFWAPNVAYLAVTLGAIYGFGCGVVFIVINVCLAQHFDRYRAIAFGVVYSGSTMASFVFPNLLLLLNRYYSFRGVLLIFGGIILNMFALGLYIKEPSWATSTASRRPSSARESSSRSKTGQLSPPAQSSSSQMQKKASFRESLSIFKEPMFYTFLISNILFQYGFDAFMTTVVDFAVDRGATLGQAVNLLPWFSVADVTGRSLFPIAADKGLVSRPLLITICYICTGVFTILLPSATSYWQMVVFILLMGPFCGCSAVLFPCVVGDVIGLARLPLASGALGTTNGGFYFTKPFFFGHFRDVIKSYDGMYHVTGAFTLLTGIMWALILVWSLTKKRNFSLPTCAPTKGADDNL